MIKLAVTGCRGRMGQRIVALAKEDGGFHIHALVEHPDHPDVGMDVDGVVVTSDREAIKGADVLIAFTLPEGTMQDVEFCRQAGVSLVVGTTGLNENQVAQIKEAAKSIPIVYSTNMSIGVNVVFKAVEMIAETTPDSYKAAMQEAHHIHKKDAPSGTAKTLAALIRQSGKDMEDADVKAIREGEIVGDHDVVFESAEDIITIKHHAKSRDIFVKGSLVAAKFLKGKTPQCFSMRDVLGLD